MPSRSSKNTEVNTEDVNTGDAVEVSSSNDGVSVEGDTEVDTGDETDINVDNSVQEAYTYVEVIVQLGVRENVTFRREFAGGEDTSPLEILDNLVDAMKSYLESD